jgi:hypothetical protein
MNATPITAAFPGDDAWRSAKAKLQRRDRYGRFAEMGGGFSFNLRLGNGELRRVSGKVVGQSGDEDIDIEVKDSDTLADGTYSVPSMKGEAVSAILSKDALKNVKKEKVKKIKDDVFVDVDELKVAKKKKQPKKKQQAEPAPASKSKSPFRRSNRISKLAVKNPKDAGLAFADDDGMLEQRSVPKGVTVTDPATGNQIKLNTQKAADEFVKNGGALNEVPDVYVIKAIEKNAIPRGRFSVVGTGGGINGMTRMIDNSTGAMIGVKYELGESTSFTAPEPDHTPVLYKEALNEMFSELVAEQFGYEPMPMRLVKSKNGKGVALITELAQNRWGKIDSAQNPDVWHPVYGSIEADLFSYAQLRVFDALIGNVDRNTANYMLKKRSDGTYEIIPIDHSLSLMQSQVDISIPTIVHPQDLEFNDYLTSQSPERWEEMMDSIGDLLEDLRNIDLDVLGQKLNQVLDHLETMFPNEELYKKSYRAAEIARLLGTIKFRIESMLSKDPESLYSLLSRKSKAF